MFSLTICFPKIISENLVEKSEMLQNGLSRDSFQRWRPLAITDDE